MMKTLEETVREHEENQERKPKEQPDAKLKRIIKDLIRRFDGKPEQLASYLASIEHAIDAKDRASRRDLPAIAEFKEACTDMVKHFADDQKRIRAASRAVVEGVTNGNVAARKAYAEVEDLARDGKQTLAKALGYSLYRTLFESMLTNHPVLGQIDDTADTLGVLVRDRVKK